jgi:hypothetical protein
VLDHGAHRGLVVPRVGVAGGDREVGGDHEQRLLRVVEGRGVHRLRHPQLLLRRLVARGPEPQAVPDEAEVALRGQRGRGEHHAGHLLEQALAQHRAEVQRGGGERQVPLAAVALGLALHPPDHPEPVVRGAQGGAQGVRGGLHPVGGAAQLHQLRLQHLLERLVQPDPLAQQFHAAQQRVHVLQQAHQRVLQPQHPHRVPGEVVVQAHHHGAGLLEHVLQEGEHRAGALAGAVQRREQPLGDVVQGAAGQQVVRAQAQRLGEGGEQPLLAVLQARQGAVQPSPRDGGA